MRTRSADYYHFYGIRATDRIKEIANSCFAGTYIETQGLRVTGFRRTLRRQYARALHRRFKHRYFFNTLDAFCILFSTETTKFF